MKPVGDLGASPLEPAFGSNNSQGDPTGPFSQRIGEIAQTRLCGPQPVVVQDLDRPRL
jgi:hypothetical protein